MKGASPIPITSQSTHRNSVVEALRIVAMFLILALHVNNYSIGEPSTEEAINSPVSTFARCFFETVSLISVNLFVLISGWFSIRFSLKRLSAFIFQSVFIISIIYIIGIAIGKASINEIQLEECLFLTRHGWFIKAYIGLMMFSPILNHYIEHTTKKEFSTLLVCLLIFQTIYSCFFHAAGFIVSGYSTFSFVVLYLLARYIRLYGQRLIDNAAIFSLIAFVGYVAWGYLPVRLGVMRLYYMSIVYTNPFNIALALGCLMLAVQAKPRYNSIINYVAASTFAVYLCHMCNTWSADFYKYLSIYIYNHYSGIEYIAIICGLMLIVFCISILIDQPRKLIWDNISKRLSPTINKK